MPIRSYTGYLNSELLGTENPTVDGTFNISGVDQLDILMQDGAGDLVVEGDSRTGNNASNSTEDSEDPQGDQFIFAQEADGTVLFDGETFYLESTFVFEIDGQRFTGYSFEEDSGGGSVDFTILPPNLPAGEATIISVNFRPNPDSVPYAALSSGDEVIDDAPYANLDFSGADDIIAGDGDDTITSRGGADTIDAGRGNDTVNSGGGADVVDGGGGDDTINAGGGNNTVDGGAGDDDITSFGGADTIDGGSGDDEISSGGGNDTITGGAGQDTIDGGSGNDTISGDSGVAPGVQSFQGIDYSTIPDPDGSGTSIDDGDDLGQSVSVNSGTTRVDITSFSDGDNNPTMSFNNSETQVTTGLNNGPGGTSNDTLLLTGAGTDGDTSTTLIEFTSTDPAINDEVINVNFRINDIDDATWRDVVTVRAFDADGNAITVNLTGGANMVLSDTDGVAGNDTATAIDGTGNASPGTPASSLLVEIPGPVARIEIDYGNLETGGQRIDLTEIFFESTPIVVDPSGNSDIIDGGAGDDTILGQEGDDQIEGGTGDDTIDGGIGDDDIQAGDDDDEIRISAGTDTIDGGAGNDTFTAIGGESLSDETITVTVDDNGDGTIAKSGDGTTDNATSIETFIADEAAAEDDSISLTEAGLTPAEVSGLDDMATGIFTPGDGSAPVSFGGPGQPSISVLLAGTYVRPDGSEVPVKGDYQITGGDESGQVGDIAFENFENIDFSVVCFADGTLIKTAQDMRPVEDLKVGDVLDTLDNGQQTIRWVGHQTLTDTDFALKPKLRPIRIKAGALGANTPSRDLIVSPQHRMLLKSKIAIRMFDTAEILVPAKHLVGLKGVEIATDISRISYHHVMCDDHEIIEAEGALAETLYTGTEAMKAMNPEAIEEIEAVFGEVPYINRPLARLTPKGKRVRHLVNRHVKNDKPVYSRAV
ncbi:Hint domain-containing protein [Yoonia sp. 2307UL14-13]|uniref:Hint domain-containing protein n=1 Tax=Yoonia sp. 2307UL14-13 TaxID=3126506 RepID=UPI0030AABE8F